MSNHRVEKGSPTGTSRIKVSSDAHGSQLPERYTASNVQPRREMMPAHGFACSRYQEAAVSRRVAFIDTGVLTTHSTFGGRATWGVTYGGYASPDDNSHGIHIARTAASSSGLGLATASNTIAVKVCSGFGQCASSNIIAGVNFVASRAASSGRLSVAIMSLGVPGGSAIEALFPTLLAPIIHFAVAAVNENVNAGTRSPARATTTNIVDAVDRSNRKASFSNYGTVVDVWALGVNVLSLPASSLWSLVTEETPVLLLSSALKPNAQGVITGATSGTANLHARPW
ncbi:hypothetical protein OPQ81_007425 [Rhizoctonia solani]|nr:hypothetical protein OPQ81_007425 [Rhizoctonia solani]